MFPFSEVGVSFWMDCFCLLIFDAPANVVFILSWSFIFSCISIISSSENQTFFIIVLTGSPSLWLEVWKFESSCQISIILFQYPRCVGLLRKKQWNSSWLSSLVHVLSLGLWLVCGSFSHYLCTWKKNSQHSLNDVRSPMLTIKRYYYYYYFEGVSSKNLCARQF